jgi:hypothetical protein
MKKSKEVKAKSARIKEHIEGVIESLTKNKEGEPIAGPYYGNRTVKRDNTREDWRAGFTKPTLASRRKKRRAATKRLRRR